MIFQRGNPLDYERWARRPRHGRPGTTRTACRTSTGWRTASRPTPDDPFRGHDGPLALERGPATNPLFEAFFRAGRAGRLLRAPMTSTATGRRASPPFDRNIRHGRRLSAARAYLHPVMNRPNLDGRDPRVRVTGSSSRASGRSASSTSTAAGPPRRSAPARSSSAAARSTPRSCCSSPASATPRSSSALGIDVVHDLPGVGENLQDHLEVYIQYACKQPVSMQKYLQVARTSR